MCVFNTGLKFFVQISFIFFGKCIAQEVYNTTYTIIGNVTTYQGPYNTVKKKIAKISYIKTFKKNNFFLPTYPDFLRG